MKMMKLPDTLSIEVTKGDVVAGIDACGGEDVCGTCPTAQALIRSYPPKSGHFWSVTTCRVFLCKHSGLPVVEYRQSPELQEQVLNFSMHMRFVPGIYTMAKDE